MGLRHKEVIDKCKRSFSGVVVVKACWKWAIKGGEEHLREQKLTAVRVSEWGSEILHFYLFSYTRN